MKALILSPDERKSVSQSVKLTGRTVRFKGMLDLEAAQRYFEIPQAARRRVKWFNLTDVWRIHTNAFLPIAASVFASGQRVRLRCVQNHWVSRFLTLYGYDDLLENGSITHATVPQRVRIFAQDDIRAHQYVADVVEEILKRGRHLGKDVAESLEWALSELIGNVYDHGRSKIGVVVQFLVQPGLQRVLFTLVDAGIGLRTSLSGVYPQLGSDAEAIQLAIEKGVTSKRGNQGWGLFGSSSIVKAGHGRMTLWSGTSALRIFEDGSSRFFDMPNIGGTMVSWILPTRANIDLARVLEHPNRATSLVLEKYEPELGTICLHLASESPTFGDRVVGRKLRTKLINLIENSRAKRCVIDFSGVRLVTNSFADEFLGKTALLFGARFHDFVRVDNISGVNKAIMDVAISRRLQTEREETIPMRVPIRTGNQKG